MSITESIEGKKRIQESIIEFLEEESNAEENHENFVQENHEGLLRESIKCHHKDVTKYIIYNLIKEEDLNNNNEKKYYGNLYEYCFKYYITNTINVFMISGREKDSIARVQRYRENIL